MAFGAIKMINVKRLSKGCDILFFNRAFAYFTTRRIQFMVIFLTEIFLRFFIVWFF